MSNASTGVHRPLCPEGKTIESDSDCQPCAERSRPYVLAATITASAVAFIDGSIVTIALPAMQAGLDASFGAMQWVVNSYALMLGGLILIGGSLGDHFGRRKVFIWGLWIFALASLACAIAPNVSLLIAGRVVKGIGAALLVPQSLAIIAASFPKEIRGKAIGIWAGASAITTALGPPLGGILIDWFAWRSVFWITIPLAIFALVLTLTHVPESRDPNRTGDAPLDWFGGLTAILSFGALTLALTLFAENTNAVSGPVMLLILGIIGLGVFLVIEKRAQDPLMPLALFANRTFTGANAMTLFLYGALSGVMFLLPFELIERRELSASQVGLILLPLGLIIGIFSRFSGKWADQQGAKLPLAIGSLLVTAAVLLLATTLENLWLGVVVPVMTLAFGMSLVVAPLTTAVMNSAPDEQSGAASGVNNAASRLAGLFSIALMGALSSILFSQSLIQQGVEEGIRFGQLPGLLDAQRSLFESAFLSAYQISMVMAACASGLAALLAIGFIPGKSKATVES